MAFRGFGLLSGGIGVKTQLSYQFKSKRYQYFMSVFFGY